MPGPHCATLVLALALSLGAPAAAQSGASPGSFVRNGTRIHYVARGSGPPVLLVHGFAVTADFNWGPSGLLDSLAGRYRVIAPDLRGHGASEKPRDPGSYGVEFVEDLLALLDHLAIPRAHVAGYSMGSAIALHLAVRHPDRVASLMLGGMGWRPAEAGPPPIVLAWLPRLDRAALGEMTVAEALSPPGGQGWDAATRAMLDRNDATALAAVLRGGAGLAVAEAELRAATVPAVAVLGSDDELVREDVARLAGVLPGLEVIQIPGRDHFSVAGDPRFARAILRFLDGR